MDTHIHKAWCHRKRLQDFLWLPCRVADRGPKSACSCTDMEKPFLSFKPYWEHYFAEQKGCCCHCVGDITGELSGWIPLYLTCDIFPGIQRPLGQCPALQHYFSSADSWKQKNLMEKKPRRHQHQFFIYTVSQRFYISKQKKKRKIKVPVQFLVLGSVIYSVSSSQLNLPMSTTVSSHCSKTQCLKVRHAWLIPTVCLEEEGPAGSSRTHFWLWNFFFRAASQPVSVLF